MTWRSLCASRWRTMWLAMRLEYWMSLCRFRISQMVSGSSPVGFHRCTAKISEFRRG